MNQLRVISEKHECWTPDAASAIRTGDLVYLPGLDIYIRPQK